LGIHRAPRPDHHFTQIRNDVLRDDRLSYRARGILACILSRPDDWETTSEALSRQGQEGRDAIRTALGELEDAGYLRREKRQDGRGRWATHQIIYDTPTLEDQGALFAPPGTDFQASVLQSSENQALLEHPHEQATPDGVAAPAAKTPADQVATGIYDHAQGMVQYIAVRQIAARALKVKGSTVESVLAAMVKLYGAGRPITFQTVGQELASGAGSKTTNDDHWANGGQW
jgi:hypothetical protein